MSYWQPIIIVSAGNAHWLASVSVLVHRVPNLFQDKMFFGNLVKIKKLTKSIWDANKKIYNPLKFWIVVGECVLIRYHNSINKINKEVL